MGSGAAFGDIDNVGDIDCVVSNNNGPANLLIKTGIPENNWIGFELIGNTCNRDAIGAKITIAADNGNQIAYVNPGASYLASNDKRIVFGLDDAKMIAAIKVDWPGGKEETFTIKKVKQYYRIVQGEGLSELAY